MPAHGSDDSDDNSPLIESMRVLSNTNSESKEGQGSGNGKAEALPKLEYPGNSRIVQAGPRLGPDGKPHYLIDDIPDNEKLRLIRESGILKKYSKDKKHGTGSDVDEDEELDYDELEQLQKESDRSEEDIPPWMNAFVYSVALIAIYGLFEVLVNQQYSIDISLGEVCRFMVNASPAIYIVVYIATRYQDNRWAKLAMLMFACLAGCYFIHLNLHSPRLGIMRRAPGLVTIWIFLIFMLDVRPAIINLLVVGIFWLWDPFRIDI